MRTLPYSVIESTQSPWDLGSRIDTPSQNVGNYCIGQLSSWVQVGRSHDMVMGMRVVLGEVVTEVSSVGFPINEKLALPGAVLDPIEAHIDGFGYFLFDCAVGKAFCGIVVDAVCSQWLRVPEFLEGSAYQNGLLAIVKGGTNFGFSGRRHHVVEDLGDGMDKAVERGVSARWLGRVSGLVAKEIVATDAVASAGFVKVGGVTVEVQDHVTGALSDGGVRVGRSIIEEPNGCFMGCCVAFDFWDEMVPIATSMVGSKATQETRDATVWFLNYAAYHPDATIRYNASDMVLHIHSDAS